MIQIGSADPGTYVIVADGEEHTVEADSLDYDQEGQLVARKDGQTVGVFRWWSSVVRKSDA